LAALLHGTLVVGVSQTLRRWTEGVTYVRQGGHHVGHWPTFLVLMTIKCVSFKALVLSCVEFSFVSNWVTSWWCRHSQTWVTESVQLSSQVALLHQWHRLHLSLAFHFQFSLRPIISSALHRLVAHCLWTICQRSVTTFRRLIEMSCWSHSTS